MTVDLLNNLENCSLKYSRQQQELYVLMYYMQLNIQGYPYYVLVLIMTACMYLKTKDHVKSDSEEVYIQRHLYSMPTTYLVSCCQVVVKPRGKVCACALYMYLNEFCWCLYVIYRIIPQGHMHACMYIVPSLRSGF